MSRNDKTATITFHNSYNCGSMLQALALQKVLIDKYGVDNEILDFSNQGQNISVCHRIPTLPIKN